MAHDERTLWLAQAATIIMTAAIDGDTRQWREQLTRVIARYGTRGLYSLSYALAESVVRLAKLERGPDHYWGMEVYDLDGAEVGAVDAIASQPTAVKAMQFVLAKANDDAGMRLALFEADAADGHPVIPIGLIHLVAVYGRHRAAEHQAAERQAGLS